MDIFKNTDKINYLASIKNSPVIKAKNGNSGFYKNWTDGDVIKLQMFLAKEGLYNGDFDGIAGNMTKRAVMEYQKQKGLTQDGMWGRNTEAASGGGVGGGAVGYEIANKGIHKPTHKTKVGFGAYDPNANMTLKQIPVKVAQEAINYYMSNPELLYSDDSKHAAWRQIFNNSGEDGKYTLDMAYGMLSPEDQKKISFKKLSSNVKENKIKDAIHEGQNEFLQEAAALAPIVTAPIMAPAILASPLVAGGTVLGGMMGGAVGSGVGQFIGKDVAYEKVTNPDGTVGYKYLYQDPNSNQYGVTSITFDPEKTIATYDNVGTAVGSVAGGALGGYAMSQIPEIMRSATAYMQPTYFVDKNGMKTRVNWYDDAGQNWSIRYTGDKPLRVRGLGKPKPKPGPEPPLPPLPPPQPPVAEETPLTFWQRVLQNKLGAQHPTYNALKNGGKV